MKERSFDEMIAYFNRRVADMDISQDYKMELLGMVTAIGYKHEKSAQQWISCSERLPEKKGEYLVTYHPCYWDIVEPEIKVGIDSFLGKTSWAKRKYQRVIAWMELPEAAKLEG